MVTEILNVKDSSYVDVPIPMSEMLELRNMGLLCRRNKVDRMRDFHVTFSDFIQRIDKQEIWTIEQLRELPFFEYICMGYKGKVADIHSPRIMAKAIHRMQYSIALFRNIKCQGMKMPLDVYRDGVRFIVERGNRRLEIAEYLGYREVPCRIFSSYESYVQNRDAPFSLAQLMER